MAEQHTPGPWTATFSSWLPGNPTRGWAVRSDQRKHSVASNNCAERINNEEFSPDELEANARLIAAAPELLEALEALLAEAEDVFVCMADATGIDRHNLPKPFSAARAAIAKATGGA